MIWPFRFLDIVQKIILAMILLLMGSVMEVVGSLTFLGYTMIYKTSGYYIHLLNLPFCFGNGKKLVAILYFMESGNCM